ncbi:MAG: mucoidy inhibitor MuiA family protein [Desulfobulbus sp.]|nr:mucoidy inhibitor MuiA family protein [Desulfobulbus sp.]
MIRLLTVLFLFVPTIAWSAPVQVTLFPASALVKEAGKVTAVPGEEGLSAITLTLPGQADPSTLRFDALPGGTTIVDVTWTSRQEQNQTALSTLNTRLQELKTQRNTIKAEQEGLRGRMAFWQTQNKHAEKDLTALRELASEVSSTLQADTLLLLKLDQKLEDVNKLIERTEKEIAEAAGHDRKVWEVTVLCSGEPPKELSFDYTMTDCGWTPLYRLEARPEKKTIDFSWQARVWQSSGQDWSSVQLHLATMQPDFRGEPGKLPPWEIGLRAVPRAEYSSADVMGKAMLMRSAPEAVPAAAPQEVRHTTYAAWDMGKRSLPAGKTRVLSIKNETWPAVFIHVLRPSLDPKAYVRAKIHFDEPRDYPRGNGLFLIDGATVEQRQFSFSGKEATMFFGVDPFLTCKTILRDKKTGDKGLFKSKQTFVRHWDMVITNAATHALDYRLEEPSPLVRDERIKLNLTSTPPGVQEDDPDILIWEGSVNAGSTRKVSVSLSFEAPEDLDINPGWHW